MLTRRVLLLLAAAAIVLEVGIGSAFAEHRASRATFSAINRLLSPSARTLRDHLVSVDVSSKGPYALAFEAGGQDYRGLLKENHRRWHYVADVTVSTGLRCKVAPQAVIQDLHLLRYVTGHRCFGPR
ncbi:MAG: hypothetical protein M3Y17_08685 [Actinomycetota bacterium]|nr:hypothetical protein [Actinomycetota bacterium]